ncbi:MAG: hypothetical protein OEW58_07265 [Gammaproteobacteria bacterium]|nr:hypothetical protein [Gammaproteobacteria bacterium]
MRYVGRQLAALSILLMMTTPVHAENWSNHDTAWEATYMAVHLADWGQTRDIAAHCNGDLNYYEKNPLLGSCPSTTTVDVYFLTTGVLHYKIAQTLSPRYRRMFQVGTLALQINSINNNKKIGLKISF